ncbi:MAG: efflux transporter outer membrane subunit [Phycisphaerales bacterium]|nr:efflux transporter outer membrane subunit [Phycisphaerales bacterium]MCB9854377.1 efflux transporter outer membrane subunit [Phycisphaerales bacterium]MCB9863578.1 efflux transporter outer membrane subunit [Phycisphaerales bacterium]
MALSRHLHLTHGRLAASLLLVIVGCTSNRQMQTDAMDARARAPWRTPIEGASDPRADELHWWNRFNDPILGDLVQRALKANLDLAAARQRIVQAQARRGVVNADRLPKIDFEASHQRAGAGDDALGFAAPPPGFETHLFAAGIVAGWEVDLWGRVQRLVDAADADAAVAVEDYRDAAVSLLGELALAYIDTRTLDVRIDLIEKNVAIQRRTLELAEARLRAGNGPELDVTQSRRLLRRTLARVPELRRARTVAENRIAILVGERPQANLIPSGSVPQTPLPINTGLPADLITRRNDIRRASWAYRAALARTDAADLERLPRLTLSGSFRLSSDDIARFGNQAYIYSFGPQISFPLLDGHRIDANVRLNESLAEQARLSLEQTLLRAIEEVENASAGYARKREQIQELEKAVAAAERSAILAEELYKSGLRDLSQLLDTQRELVAVQDDLAVARQDLLAQMIRLYRALGGGWKAIDLDGIVKPLSGTPPESTTKSATKRDREE